MKRGGKNTSEREVERKESEREKGEKKGLKDISTSERTT